jgi:hypothetical protein
MHQTTSRACGVVGCIAAVAVFVGAVEPEQTQTVLLAAIRIDVGVRIELLSLFVGQRHLEDAACPVHGALRQLVHRAPPVVTLWHIHATHTRAVIVA